MSAALHLAGPADLAKLDGLAAAFHAEIGLEIPEDTRAAALGPVCDGIPHAAAYLIGPRAAPVGYILLAFSWGVESGGLDCMIDEFYIRPKLRGRGIGLEALLAVARMLQANGVAAIYLEVDRADERTQRLYAKAGFKPRERFMLMGRPL